MADKNDSMLAHSLSQADVKLASLYLGAFKVRENWTPEDHAAGLRAVWLAGYDARFRVEGAKK